MTHPTDQDAGMILFYERLAPVYDRLHQRWLRFSGGEAQAALEAAVRVEMTPQSQLLDAGCGTGRFARRLLSEGVAPDRITLVDPSPAMLARCADLPVERICGRLEALPLPEACFDVVTCAWVLETVATPEQAIDELARVLRPGGLLCLTFCAQKPARGVVDWVMQKRVTHRKSGRFLCVDQITSQASLALQGPVRSLPSAGSAATVIGRRSVN